MRPFVRRLLSITSYVVLFCVTTVISPLLLLLGVLVDIPKRTNFSACRSIAYFWWYMACELAGIFAFLFLRVAYYHKPVADAAQDRSGSLKREAYLAKVYGLQRWWANCLFQGLCKLFSLQFKYEGTDAFQQSSSTPILLFMRHASIVDVLLPSRVSYQFKLRLRYVIKKELQMDPCLDLVSEDLRTYFVNRKASNLKLVVEEVGQLASDLSPSEGVIIYPEGTRFTPQRWKQALQHLLDTNASSYQMARQMEHVMPPKVKGPLSLLNHANGRADVVFCAHHGLEGLSTTSKIFTGGLVGRKVSIKFWRVAAKDIPATTEERIQWLMGEWSHVNEFVRDGGSVHGTTTDSQQPQPTTTSTSTSSSSSQ